MLVGLGPAQVVEANLGRVPSQSASAETISSSKAAAIGKSWVMSGMETSGSWFLIQPRARDARDIPGPRRAARAESAAGSPTPSAWIRRPLRRALVERGPLAPIADSGITMKFMTA